jgi:hypothetical protein
MARSSGGFGAHVTGSSGAVGAGSCQYSLYHVAFQQAALNGLTGFFTTQNGSALPTIPNNTIWTITADVIGVQSAIVTPTNFSSHTLQACVSNINNVVTMQGQTAPQATSVGNAGAVGLTGCGTPYIGVTGPVGLVNGVTVMVRPTVTNSRWHGTMHVNSVSL